LSGLVYDLARLLLAALFLDALLQDPLRQAEWAAVAATDGAPDAATYFAHGEILGALIHLLIQTTAGVVLGAAGGALGAGLAALRKRSSRSTLADVLPGR
jgi:hypothetical protein